jgi:hypothetical protein
MLPSRRRGGQALSPSRLRLILHATEKLNSIDLLLLLALSASSKAGSGSSVSKSLCIAYTTTFTWRSSLKRVRRNAMEDRDSDIGVPTMLNIPQQSCPTKLGGMEEDLIYLDTEYKKDESLEWFDTS